MCSAELSGIRPEFAEGWVAKSTFVLRERPMQIQAMARQHETISLTPAEGLLRRLLLDCRNEMPSDLPMPKLEIWFTGGWVRDKVLGIQSSDIDAALSVMTGVQFGEALETFYSRNEVKYTQEAQKLDVPAEFKSLHRTTRRPDKSKHLETCIAHIFVLDVDLVNLREETYTQDSRNPQMVFSTPERDASRRDATINALFYNLEKQQVEDFTGKGLQDMAAGVIKTPLNAYETFMDDPLRVLRLIRFASKLGYTIDDEVKQSMKNEKIHVALNAKISRERVGIEVGKMMTGRDPARAFQLIYEMGLYSTVFLGPGGQLQGDVAKVLPFQQPDRPWPSTWPHAYRVLAALLNDTSSTGRLLAQSEDNSENCWMMAAYAPIAELRRTNPNGAIQKATEAIKPTSKTTKLLEDALKHMDDIQSIVDLIASYSQTAEKIPRSTIGMAIRSWGATWKVQVLYALLAEVVYEVSDHGFFAAQIGRYFSFSELVYQEELQGVVLMKPILDGDDVKGLFKLEKSGPFMKKVLDGIARWQLDNVNSSKDEATEWLYSQKDKFDIP